MSSINIKVYPMLDLDKKTFGMSINGSSLGVYFRTYDDVVHVANEIAAKAISPSGVVVIDYSACLEQPRDDTVEDEDEGLAPGFADALRGVYPELRMPPNKPGQSSD